MRLSRSRQVLSTWIACFAILWAALAPSISHALQSGLSQQGPGSGWTEVCAVTGAKLVLLEPDNAASSSKSPSEIQTLKHCPYCSLHSQELGLPPAPPDQANLLLPHLSQAVPALFLHAPRRLHAWVSAQPRAPPLR